MMILVGLVCVVVVGYLLARYGSWDGGAETVGVLTTALGSIALVIALIAVPVERMESLAKLAELRALQATASTARANADGLEAMSFRMKVAEANAWLARAQYYRGTVFALWVAPEVETAEPIQ